MTSLSQRLMRKLGESCRDHFSQFGANHIKSGTAPDRTWIPVIFTTWPWTTSASPLNLDAGDSDHKYLKATQKFQRVLEQLNIAHEFRVFPGGHGIVGPDTGWNYWHKHLDDSLGFVGKQFQVALTELTPQTPPMPPHKSTHPTTHQPVR